MANIETVLHTAEGDRRDREELVRLLARAEELGCQGIELDFIARGGKLYWAPHNWVLIAAPGGLFKSRGFLCIEEVLEELGGELELMVDIKYLPGLNLHGEKYAVVFEKLGKRRGGVKVETLDLRLLDFLSAEQFAGLEIGLIVNVISKRHRWIRPEKLAGLFAKLRKSGRHGFLSISSELFIKKDGQFVADCRRLFPGVQICGWVWSARGQEKLSTLKTLRNRGATVIITASPELVRKL